MRSMRPKLKAVLFAPVISVLLLLALPLQSIHAQSTSMNHQMSNTNTSGLCPGACGNSASVAKDVQKSPDRKQEKDPEPPEQLPLYAQNTQFPEPQKPASNLIYGSLIRPPDLVKLYANFRF